jgi:hypothetical protein
LDGKDSETEENKWSAKDGAKTNVILQADATKQILDK